MKKYLSLFAVLLLMLSISACGTSSVVTTETEPVKGELKFDELAKIVAKNLGVPDGLDFTYEIGERFYWEAGEIWLRHVAIHVEDGGSATAAVDPTTGELIRSILNYEKTQ